MIVTLHLNRCVAFLEFYLSAKLEGTEGIKQRWEQHQFSDGCQY